MASGVTGKPPTGSTEGAEHCRRGRGTSSPTGLPGLKSIPRGTESLPRSGEQRPQPQCLPTQALSSQHSVVTHLTCHLTHMTAKLVHQQSITTHTPDNTSSIASGSPTLGLPRHHTHSSSVYVCTTNTAAINQPSNITSVVPTFVCS